MFHVKQFNLLCKGNIMTEKRIPFVPADDLSKLWRAIIEFDMLAPGDRILIGLSGGKDSMFLTAALAEIKKYSPIPFDLACYTVNAMFAPDFPKQNRKTRRCTCWCRYSKKR